jgi:succinyl-diaminopimelate desuccinylase
MVSQAVIEKVHDEIDSNEKDAASFLSSLVKIRTEVPPGENFPDISKTILAKMKEFTSEAKSIPVSDEWAKRNWPPGMERPRVNTVGWLRGTGSGRTLILNGHVDVVPAGKGWTVDPYAGLIKDEVVYGRGSSDNKGGVAALVMAARAIVESEIRLKGNAVLTATVDEEVGGKLGLGYLVESKTISGDYCMVLDGNLEYIGISGQGSFAWKVDTIGKAAHSSIPWKGVNAINKMAKIVLAVEKHAEDLHKRTTKIPASPETGKPFIFPTINTGVIEGGVKENAVPDRCSIRLYRRITPEEDPKRARTELEEVFRKVSDADPDIKWKVEELFKKDPWMTPQGANNPLVKTIRVSAREVLGVEPPLYGMTGGGDGEHTILRGGIPSCNFGPGRKAHGVHGINEHLPVQDLQDLTKIAASTILRTLEVVE